MLAVRSQVGCGGGSAFATTTAFGDLNGLAGSSVGQLSPQDLFSCDAYDLGCAGGHSVTALEWTKSNGVTTEECIPYGSDIGVVPACPSTCRDGDSITLYKISYY